MPTVLTAEEITAKVKILEAKKNREGSPAYTKEQIDQLMQHCYRNGLVASMNVLIKEHDRLISSGLLPAHIVRLAIQIDGYKKIEAYLDFIRWGDGLALTDLESTEPQSSNFALQILNINIDTVVELLLCQSGPKKLNALKNFVSWAKTLVSAESEPSLTAQAYVSLGLKTLNCTMTHLVDLLSRRNGHEKLETFITVYQSTRLHPNKAAIDFLMTDLLGSSHSSTIKFRRKFDDLLDQLPSKQRHTEVSSPNVAAWQGMTSITSVQSGVACLLQANASLYCADPSRLGS